MIDGSSSGGQAVDEFDSVAAWTARVLATMTPDERVPGACRGSGQPSALEWLAEGLGLTAGQRLLDAGGGLGGPSAFAVRRYGVAAAIVEPMPRAAGWAHRLFGLPAVAASAEDLPMRAGSFDAAWSLAVLSTVDDKAGLLRDVARVLRPGGGFGVIDYVAAAPIDVPPEGNQFLSPPDLVDLLEGAGFEVLETADGRGLPAPGPEWTALADRAKRALADAHPGAPILAAAERQERRFGELLADGALVEQLVRARRRDAPGGPGRRSR